MRGSREVKAIRHCSGHCTAMRLPAQTSQWRMRLTWRKTNPSSIFSPVTTEVWHSFFKKIVKLSWVHNCLPFVFIPKAQQHLREGWHREIRSDEKTQIKGRGGYRGTEEHTFSELSILLGELLLLVELQEAVVPQATCVRQTLDYRIQETLQRQNVEEVFMTKKERHPGRVSSKNIV